MDKSFSRRNFIKSLAVSAAAIPVLHGLSLFGANVARAAGNPPLPESDPFAKSIKYCADADKAAKSKTSSCPARKEKDRATQYCRNCQLYTKESGDGAKETGKCMIVQGKSVAGGGWCMSWVKKPT